MLTRESGRAKGAVAAAVIMLAAVAGSGWAIGSAAHAATDTPTPEAAVPGVAELCPDGKVPMLDIAKFPRPGVVGAESAAAAVASETTRSVAGAATFLPFGAGRNDPVWVTTENSSYIVTPTLDGGWFASPASLLACNSLNEIK